MNKTKSRRKISGFHKKILIQHIRTWPFGQNLPTSRETL
ncbi:hypothetical protein LEP1GSC018_3968 [Leptospira kirschneri str. 2008720114]|nr:hypothetical protein LEP1GSC018_3968 [Leptospira kirschneri str. 2008720114]